MKITGKEDLRNPIFFLSFFSLMSGAGIGSLSKDLESFGSVILGEPIFSFINLVWFYFAGLFIYYSFKDKLIILKFAYFLGSISFILTESVISGIGYKSLYFVKIAIMFVVVGLTMKHLTDISGLYQSAFLQNDKDKL
jgi:hypothetical protein